MRFGHYKEFYPSGDNYKLTIMKKNNLKVVKASCGSSGCDIKIYVLPFGGTREEFKKEVGRRVEIWKEVNKKAA